MRMQIYQLVDSPEILNPYGVRRYAEPGQGQPVMCFVDGPCIKIRFV